MRRLECLDHLIRMENSIIPKVALDAKLEGKRKVRRPKLRWLDDIQDLKMIGIKRWRRKAQDRPEWMDVIREAKVKLQRP
jgi:hypothetical protein